MSLLPAVEIRLRVHAVAESFLRFEPCHAWQDGRRCISGEFRLSSRVGRLAALHFNSKDPSSSSLLGRRERYFPGISPPSVSHKSAAERRRDFSSSQSRSPNREFVAAGAALLHRRARLIRTTAGSWFRIKRRWLHVHAPSKEKEPLPVRMNTQRAKPRSVDTRRRTLHNKLLGTTQEQLQVQRVRNNRGSAVRCCVDSCAEHEPAVHSLSVCRCHGKNPSRVPTCDCLIECQKRCLNAVFLLASCSLPRFPPSYFCDVSHASSRRRGHARP